MAPFSFECNLVNSAGKCVLAMPIPNTNNIRIASDGHIAGIRFVNMSPVPIEKVVTNRARLNGRMVIFIRLPCTKNAVIPNNKNRKLLSLSVNPKRELV